MVSAKIKKFGTMIKVAVKTTITKEPTSEKKQLLRMITIETNFPSGPAIGTERQNRSNQIPIVGNNNAHQNRMNNESLIESKTLKFNSPSENLLFNYPTANY